MLLLRRRRRSTGRRLFALHAGGECAALVRRRRASVRRRLGWTGVLLRGVAAAALRARWRRGRAQRSQASEKGDVASRARQPCRLGPVFSAATAAEGVVIATLGAALCARRRRE